MKTGVFKRGKQGVGGGGLVKCETYIVVRIVGWGFKGEGFPSLRETSYGN